MDKATAEWLQQRVRQRRLALRNGENGRDEIHEVETSEPSQGLSNEETRLATTFRTKVNAARKRRQRKAQKSLPEDKNVISLPKLEKSKPLKDERQDPFDSSRTDVFKERIRGRIRQVKEKAEKDRIEKEVTEEVSAKNNEDDSVKTERAISARRRKVQNLWQTGIRETIQESRESKERVTFESSYDFFTRIWDQEPEEDGRNAQDEESHSIEIDDRQELLENEFQKIDWVLVQQTKADYIPSEEWKTLEKELYFVPSANKVPLLHKMGDGREVRKLEEEGLYVGVRPDIPEKNLNRIENRLLRQNEFNWFGDDGKVKMLPLPTRKGYCRSTNLVDQDSTENIVYCKAEFFSDGFGKLSNNGLNQLDVDVAGLFFRHHPLFSREHVLVSWIQTLHREYSHMQERDTLIAISQQIKAVKLAHRRLRETEASSEQEARSREQRVAHYYQKLRRLRHAHDKVESEQRSLLKNILESWSAIKKLRDENRYTCTNIKLIIHKEESNFESDEKEWNNQIQEELEEMAEVQKLEYFRSVEKYEAEMQKWKQWMKSRRQATKRQRKREHSEGSGSVSQELEDTLEEDSRILKQEPLPEPNPPPKFDADAALKAIREKAMKIRRKPGEPKMTFEIDHSGSITPKDQCPLSEQQRRADVAKRKIYVKIYFNDKEVCQTSSRQLSQEFSVVWAEIFPLWIQHRPQSLCLKIFESVGLTTTLLCETYWPIPDITVVSGTATLEEQEFSSDQRVTCHHSGVGSGLQQSFPGEDSKPQWLLTGGVLRCGVAWGIGEDGQILSPNSANEMEQDRVNSSKLGQTVHKMNLSALSNINQLKKWLEECHLDPNDPENENLFETVEHLELLHGENGTSKEHGFFRLDPLHAEFDFVTKTEIANNSRYQLLQLRTRENTDFRNYQMVPINEKEIPLETVERLWRKEGSDETERRDLTTHPQKSLQLLNKVREQVLRQFLLAHHERTLEDMVIEEKVPSIGTLGFNLLRLMRKRRPLRPTRKQRKKMTGQGMTNTDVKLVVMVMRAANVPVRVDTDALRTPRRPISFEGMSFESKVRPFVEVMFQRETKRTQVAEGPHPTWNEELHLPFKAPNDDYFTSSLEKVQDIIYLNLFDEVLVDLLEDERDRENTVHQKMERRWLGSLKIPFSTLYLNSKIEGTFRLNMPPVLLGYEEESKPWASVPDATPSTHTYLSVYLTLEPSLQLPEVLREKRTNDPFLRNAADWQQQLEKKFPRRPIRAVALDISASWVFTPRYLRPLEPPQELIDTDPAKTDEKLARFVSLIPTTPDKIVYPGVCDIWATCDQFLQLLSGDEEEHAILLCNFFLSLGRRAYLLMGAGIPEGPTAYVLSIENNGREVRIWNATTGDSFITRESHIPLHTVGSLISPDNIWANVQKYDNPSRMSFDLSNTNHWQPYFDRKHRSPTFASIQPEKLLYSPINRRYVDELWETIESTLRESLMRWRKRFRTSWNRYCIQVLRNVLPRLEENIKGDIEAVKELETILASHKMCGFPLNMPFTNIDIILDTVFATGVHLAEGKEMEFALAVYLHPYPCSVISVWIYVATLVRRQ